MQERYAQCPFSQLECFCLTAAVALSHIFMIYICLTQRAPLLQYDIPVLLHKADAFLGKAMEDRTTDRLRCKPAFWASQKHGVTDCAMRFLIFAGNSRGRVCLTPTVPSCPSNPHTAWRDAPLKSSHTSTNRRCLRTAEQAGLPLMQRAVQNLLAHIIILDSTLDLTQHLLGGQVPLRAIPTLLTCSQPHADY